MKPVALPADRLLGVLVNTCTRDLAYQLPFGPWNAETARPVLHQVMNALGPDSYWRSNNDFSYAEAWSADGQPDAYASDPVTGHCFNRALVGSGNGVVVTFLAVADD
ncbi:hypothetical protein ALI144C_06250 [Actinosynnema sp. ALI-1.44]|nr:hypothetical protein ALI144C_06250 [Actinosynnema sp. ALI-1.44]